MNINGLFLESQGSGCQARSSILITRRACEDKWAEAPFQNLYRHEAGGESWESVFVASARMILAAQSEHSSEVHSTELLACGFRGPRNWLKTKVFTTSPPYISSSKRNKSTKQTKTFKCFDHKYYYTEALLHRWLWKVTSSVSSRDLLTYFPRDPSLTAV